MKMIRKNETKYDKIIIFLFLGCCVLVLKKFEGNI